MDGEFYADTQEFLARLDARRSEQLQALRAFGEAIAMVAQARLIERVAAGGMVSVELGDGRAFELWSRDETIYIGGWGHDGEVELRRFRGDFEDIAAEAVAAFIEECER